MRDLTACQMSRVDGREFGGFFEGFLCGALVVAAFGITPTTSVVTRWTIYSGMVAACGLAFFD